VENHYVIFGRVFRDPKHFKTGTEQMVKQEKVFCLDLNQDLNPSCLKKSQNGGQMVIYFNYIELVTLSVWLIFDLIQRQGNRCWKQFRQKIFDLIVQTCQTN